MGTAVDARNKPFVLVDENGKNIPGPAERTGCLKEKGKVMSTEERAENVERELGVARRVDLVDASGPKRVVVHTGKDGPLLFLLDKSGEFSAVLCLTKDSPVKNLFCEMDELGAVLDVPTDTMKLDLYDAEKKLQSSFGMGDLPRIVELRSAEDKIQVVISVDGANLQFLLHDAGGCKRASLAMG